MTKSNLAAKDAVVKSELEAVLSTAMTRLAELAEQRKGQRDLELEVWRHILLIGQLLLSYVFTLRCLRSSEVDLERQGLSLSSGDVRLRNDKSYRATLMTTCGPVSFPMGAYRNISGPAPVTRVPARADFLPSYKRFRSSELCLEWEVRLGASLPFRKAQASLTHFTHGAVRLEDTTLARHMVAIGNALSRDWLYLQPEKIAEVLRDRATCDLETKRPILYVSSDALALRRYINDSWKAVWKMANGIRLWCVDRETGATIHLGGEYTFGDCEVVEAAIAALIDGGQLPHDGRYPGVDAELVFITDGMPWLEERIINQFSRATAILDLYHVLEHVMTYAVARHGKGTPAAKRLYRRIATLLLGSDRASGPKGPSKKRKGHSKRRRLMPPEPAVYTPLPPDRVLPAEAVLNLLKQYEPTAPNAAPAVEARDALINYITRNADRIDYPWFRSVGYQIGSGAMESLHRTAVQDRVKRPGARWLPETAEAIFSLRMLSLVGREDEFWGQPNITQWIQHAFAANAKTNEPSLAAAA